MPVKTIVVVDDEPEAARLMKRILETEGHRVFMALEGRSGIEMILRLKPDLVLLDVRMPIVQGYEACRYLRSQGELRNTKILMVSGLGTAHDVQWSAEAGADAYLKKPFQREDLVERVQELLAQ
jgi:two-component system cell cycle response regulator